MHVLLVPHVGGARGNAAHPPEEGGERRTDPVDGQRTPGQPLEGGTSVTAPLQRVLSGNTGSQVNKVAPASQQRMKRTIDEVSFLSVSE